MSHRAGAPFHGDASKANAAGRRRAAIAFAYASVEAAA